MRFVSVILFLFLICHNGYSAETKNMTIYYVSQSGSDLWSGKLTVSNKSKTDGPFKTLEKARDILRENRKNGTISSSGAVVYIRGGIYSLPFTFKLSEEDSGTDSSPVNLGAYPGEKVYITGGKTINGFKPVKDKSVLSRFYPSCRNKIVMIDLKTQGISDFGQMTSGGSGAFKTGLELFFKGKTMKLARYPNDGWLKIENVPQTGEKLVYPGDERNERFSIPLGRHYGRFVYEGDRPKKWAVSDDIWMFGYWTWDWSDLYVKVKKFDTSNREVYPDEPQSAYGYSKNQRFYFLNVLEELDSPGEWYLDRKNGILYFWPPEPVTKNDMMVSMLDSTMVILDKTSNITIQNIIFECSRGDAIKVFGGKGNKIAGCIIRNVGDNGVIIDSGIENGILSCDIYNTGNGGIILDGGDRMTLTPAGNYAENNHIHHYSRINRTYKPAININGVGNRISHNYIHDAPHSGVLFGGNDQVLDYNEIHDIAQETGDVGAFYTANDWTQRGTLIKHNYFHHIHGPGEAGARSVYLDNWSSGITVYGNIFYKAGMATLIGGGRDNVVDNNIYVECEPSIWVDARGTTWADYCLNGEAKFLFDGMEAVKYNKPPYSEKYPELTKLYSDEPALPKGNVIIRNVSYGGQCRGPHIRGQEDIRQDNCRPARLFR